MFFSDKLEVLLVKMSIPEDWDQLSETDKLVVVLRSLVLCSHHIRVHTRDREFGSLIMETKINSNWTHKLYERYRKYSEPHKRQLLLLASQLQNNTNHRNSVGCIERNVGRRLSTIRGIYWTILINTYVRKYSHRT